MERTTSHEPGAGFLEINVLGNNVNEVEIALEMLDPFRSEAKAR